MTEVEGGLEMFIATGRTGRRNAISDMIDSKIRETSTGSLPLQMEKLHCTGKHRCNVELQGSKLKVALQANATGFWDLLT